MTQVISKFWATKYVCTSCKQFFTKASTHENDPPYTMLKPGFENNTTTLKCQYHNKRENRPAGAYNLSIENNLGQMVGAYRFIYRRSIHISRNGFLAYIYPNIAQCFLAINTSDAQAQYYSTQFIGCNGNKSWHMLFRRYLLNNRAIKILYSQGKVGYKQVL